jgi:predicted metalloendopeptidase
LPADATKNAFILQGPDIILPDTTYYAEDNPAGKQLLALYADMAARVLAYTPLTEEEGYVFRNPNASDTDKTYRLSIGGEVKQEHRGNYAFVVLDTQTRSASVSRIVELYDRAEQVLTEQSVPNGNGTGTETAGDGNGN